MKVLFRRSDGKVLGGQALSRDAAGAEKRICALALAIQLRTAIDDLAESGLCNAPQFGSSNDPPNFAGMMARGVLDGGMPVARRGLRGDGLLLDLALYGTSVSVRIAG
jgi:hypothetical protein